MRFESNVLSDFISLLHSTWTKLVSHHILDKNRPYRGKKWTHNKAMGKLPKWLYILWICITMRDRRFLCIYCMPLIHYTGIPVKSPYSLPLEWLLDKSMINFWLSHGPIPAFQFIAEIQVVYVCLLFALLPMSWGIAMP